MKRQSLLFWIKSSRGTDRKTVINVPSTWTKEDIKFSLENWCSCFGAWEASENVVRYGYKKVIIPPRKELIKKWDKLCKRKSVLDEKYNECREMLMARDVDTY